MSPSDRPLDLQRVWAAEYESSLYLRELHAEALLERYQSLIQNLWSTDQEGAVQRPRDPNQRLYVCRLLFHVVLEQARRGKPPANEMFDERAMINEATATYVPPRLTSPIVGGPGGFAKFGKRDHMRASFERGIFRIAPASSYDDPSLNGAQADKELEHFTATPNERLLFKLYRLDDDGSEVEANVKPLQLFRYMNVPDFYVWCCANSCDLRMFSEFDAEALLFVKDRAAFADRMLAAVARAQKDAMPAHGKVGYYDPYTIERSQLKPIFSKNFKYLYQDEYRFAWNMPPGSTMAPFFVELGPLSDIADLYEAA